MAQTCCKYFPFLLEELMYFLVSLKYHARLDCFSLQRFISNTFGTVKATSKTYHKLTYREAFQSLQVRCCIVPFFKVDV